MSVIALRSQVHDWVQGQVHAFEFKAEKIKLPLWVCWAGGQGRKVQEKVEGVKKIYTFPRKKTSYTKPQTERMFQKQASKSLCLFFLLGICFLPYRLEKKLLFLQFQVLSLITFANDSQPLLSTYLNQKHCWAFMWNLFLNLLIDFREREKNWFVVLLIYAFIGWFVYVPWPGIKSATLG